jgi:hypothetical protein
VDDGVAWHVWSHQHTVEWLDIANLSLSIFFRVHISGQISRNDELRTELEGIVEGLQGYLKDVQVKANKQKEDYDHLFKDKLQLEERIIDADEERLKMEQQADEISILREVRLLVFWSAVICP